MLLFFLKSREKLKLVRNRFYCESYMQLGVRENVKKDGNECRQCVICLKIMAEESMKPAKLKLHLVKGHPECAHYSEEQFRELAERLRLTATRLLQTDWLRLPQGFSEIFCHLPPNGRQRASSTPSGSVNLLFCEFLWIINIFKQRP